MQNKLHKQLTPGEREILEYIVERYSNYAVDVAYNTTVEQWVADAVEALENDDISSTANEGC